MVVFPNAKINLGLNILRRRADGYHDIETVMVPVGWRDILEIVPTDGDADTLTVTGRAVACSPDKNLVMRAVKAVRKHYPELPAVDIYLHKVIPDGAGLGGGSADAAFTVRALNDIFSLGMDNAKMAEIAAELGSDCPFFVYNRPMLATGTGTYLAPIDVDLTGKYIVIAKPRGAMVPTAAAYAGVTPNDRQTPVAKVIQLPITEWAGKLHNDFEPSVFALQPAIGHVKEVLAKTGAVYTAMSGSGAAVFAIYTDKPDVEQIEAQLADCDVFHGQLAGQ